ncbi:haloacid dehalogenase-like hydrolase [Methylobacter sp. BlB1]|uniref:haloacid dehalogenase-like hydrolase n=1 Tax=Methylobacter sp. BlB1 TaxID=2785914 RepID=UPI001895DA0F|nr:haloacid dehalogenase-like hydrolase [Methylobacter sp. BlB1]
MTSLNEIDVYVVDVCGTLVRDDTTLGLLRHHFAHTRERRLRHILFRVMTARLSPVRLGFIVLERLTGKHLLKYAVVKLLAGDQVEALAQSAAQYTDVLLKDRRVESVWSLIEQPTRTGHVVLASASLEPVVACLAAKIGARHVASQLEQQGGILTGRYTEDLTGFKEVAMLNKYGANVLAGRTCTISDNFTDLTMLEKSTQAFVVLHKKAHKKRWQGLNATFLEI